VESDGIRNWQDLLARLQKQPHVLAGAPAIYEQVLISRGARAQGAILKGILPQEERKVSDILDTVKSGSADSLEMRKEDQSGTSPPESDEPNPLSARLTASRPPIVLGKDMADQLGATVGSLVTVTSPQGELTPFGIVPKYKRFKVTGIFSSSFYEYDSSWAFIPLADAQKLFDLGDVVSVLEFKIDDIYQAPEIAQKLESAAGKGFMSTNWMEQNRAIFHALRLERVVTFITIGLIVFVAALNILISLIMMVMEKTRDIAVLVSMGAKKRQIRRIFIYQGILIGVIGTVLGLIAGYLLSWAAGHYHLVSLSAEVYSIDYVPFAPRVLDGVLVAIIAIGVSFIATLYPSWSAASVLPAEALRYE
jgi:lipoprotein-releasing system permease protein